MPSKRKKNKRRMRRVQAQRRALEEQHAANPPVKASPGIAVSAPPAAAPKKVAKTPAPAPEKIPEAIPIAVPIVETPKVEPEPVVIEPVAEPVPVEVEAPEPEAVVFEQTPVEVEVPAPITEEAPVIETPPAEPSIVEAAIVQEAEPIIPETEPVTEAVPPAEAPVVAPAETEIQTEETTIIATETEQTHNVCAPETKVEAEALAEEDAPFEAEVEVAVTEATEEPVVEALTSDKVFAEAKPTSDEVVTETVVESVEEVIAEIPEPEQVTEAVVSPAAPEEDVAEEDEPEVPTEPVTMTEDAPAQAVEIPVVPVTVPEAPVEEAEAPVTEVKEAPATQETAASLVDDFVVTESASAVEVAIAESAAVEPEIVEMRDTLNTQSESVDVMPTEPEPAAAPAEEMVIDATAEQTCPDVLSEEPKSEICDMPCQMQLAVESVQISSMEMSVEPSLNGHIVPEVSIEG
ncbi:calphotin-like isoform X1 [Siniperca chuatsi]|uniref:calphotin-like isoform X1 n=1 Tax=Siniperca chuatsi TaxID=119488 RepID=UPI001CE036FB|nr:calphotin-like isoform X1 [Siniperca chuatsi]